MNTVAIKKNKERGEIEMDKLKITIVSESCTVEGMAGCGKNNSQLCGARDCSFNGGAD